MARLRGLTNSGMSTAQALTAGARSGGRPGALLAKACRRVERGQNLARALSSLGNLLTEVEVSLLDAGESCGNLARALDLLHTRIEQQGSDRRRVVGALSYPLLLTVLTLVILQLMAVYVLPSMAGMYDELGAELPASSRALLTFGTTVSQGAGPAAVVGSFCVLIGAWMRKRLPAFRLASDALVLDTPLLGPVLMSTHRAAIYAVCATLLESGCEITNTLSLAGRCTPNREIARRLDLVRRGVARGRPLSLAFGHAGLDDDGQAAGMLSVAEASGDYAAAFARLTRVAEGERDRYVTRLSRSVEPAAVTFMAIAVAGGVLALYQPVLGSAAMLTGGMQ
ncbi:MAG: type II secretion system F family protein [Candidatus Binatia bacterium]